MRAAVILNCGSPILRKIEADYVICADGGYDWCPVVPDIVIGDRDSIVSPLPTGVATLTHNPRKNQTDAELCVEHAVGVGADELVFFGVLGGRSDHMLGNFAAMAYAKSLGVRVCAHEENLDLYLEKGRIEISTSPGRTVSVIPYGGEATVRGFAGLEYPLVGLRLTPRDARGVSNLTTGDVFSLDVTEGEVLVFHFLK